MESITMRTAKMKQGMEKLVIAKKEFSGSTLKAILIILLWSNTFFLRTSPFLAFVLVGFYGILTFVGYL